MWKITGDNQAGKQTQREERMKQQNRSEKTKANKAVCSNTGLRAKRSQKKGIESIIGRSQSKIKGGFVTF